MSTRQLVNIAYAILARDRDAESLAELDAALNDDLAGTQARDAARESRTASMGPAIRIGGDV